jgi:hypothetical protein
MWGKAWMTSSSELGPPPAVWAFQERLLPVYEALVEVGAGDVAFFCVAIEAANRRLIVCRTDEASGVTEAEYRAVVPDWTRVDFGHAVLSRRQIKTLHALVRRHREWLKARGINPQAWGPRSDMSGVGWNHGPFELTYDGRGEFDDELRKPFLLYGSGTVIFKRGRVVPL